MVDGSATTNDNARRPPASPQRPRAVSDLELLLSVLFPDPPALDCITIDDILRRYRLTGLGAPALTAIEQSQRIVRARGDYHQLGVCEFHIGLIYFTWADHRAAANQFLLARQSWTLASDASAKCLAHFAQGLALADAQHYEPAMLQYGRAERLLSQQPRSGPAATRHGALDEKMRPLLIAAQEALRVRLWPNDQSAPAAPAEHAASNAPSPAEHAVSDADSASPRSPQPQMRPATPDDRPLLGAHISNMPPIPRHRDSPIPGHALDDDRYAWYAVADRQGGFLPSIPTGIWLLADRELDELATGRSVVIVGSRQAGLGSISLRPLAQSSLTHALYLGFRISDRGASSDHPTAPADALSQLYLDDSQRAVSGSDVQVLGVVKGFWQALDGELPV
jgi:hypothetical protein